MENERSYLGALQDYYAEHRVMPSYSTLAQVLGFKSKATIAGLIARLKEAGYLEPAPGKRLKPTDRFFERPLADASVQAGFARPVYENSSDSLTIDQYLVERPSTTVLIPVKGDSMRDAGIIEGDLVVVERGRPASKGDNVIAIVDDQFTLKTLDLEKGRFILRPANPAYPVIRPQGSLEIFGVVVGLVRKY